MRTIGGFTLIEMLVTLVIMGILATSVFQLSELNLRRQQEKDLRTALWQIRNALDAYKQASDEGHIVRSADQSGYPPTLNALVEGVADAKSPSGSKLYFLRRIPADPMASDAIAGVQQGWGQRSYESPPDRPESGKDVFDVYSQSDKTGLNGVPYREW